MTKAQIKPKFRRAAMIGVGVAGAFAIAVPSIAWAVDTSPAGAPVVLSAGADTAPANTDATPAVSGVVDLGTVQICAQGMTEEELEAMTLEIDPSEAAVVTAASSADEAAADAVPADPAEVVTLAAMC